MIMTYDYDRFFEEKIKEIAKENYIVDVGGGHPFQKRLAKFRDLFTGKKYLTMDSAPEYGPDVVGDAHSLPFRDSTVGAILSISVFEHLRDPKKAAEEVYRVLKPGGKLLLYTHFIYPYHARRGVYSDYFRFTDEGLAHLFKKFSHVEIKKHGGFFRAMGFFMPFQVRLRPIWEPIAYLLDKFFKTEQRTTTAGYYIYCVK